MKRPKPLEGFKKFVNTRRKPVIKEVLREPTAGGIVYRKESGNVEILLIQDAKDRWTIPKGHIEEGEQAKDTAAREIKEETGLEKLRGGGDRPDAAGEEGRQVLLVRPGGEGHGQVGEVLPDPAEEVHRHN